MSEAVLVNGKAYDHSSARLDIFGLKVVGFTSIDYNDKLERGEVRGASQVPLGTTRGKYSADPCKITVVKTTAEEIRTHLAGLSRTGNSTGSPKGTIIVQYIDDELGVQTHELIDCRLNTGGASSSKEGADPLTEDLEFYVRLIRRNGRTLFESDEQGV
jgi:hypothetical protein